MDIFVTEIKAICPKTGELRTYSGPKIYNMISEKQAEHYIQNNGLGYCKIVGKLVAEIPCKTGSYEPDWDNMIDYEDQNLN